MNENKWTFWKSKMRNLIEIEGYEFHFEHKGIKCKILRMKDSSLFHWCGYVETGLNKELTDRQKYDLEVHGGVTYNRKFDNKYAIGFDCAHSGDICAFYCESLGLSGYKYRNKEYVIAETKLLAEQVYAKRTQWKIENFIEKILNKIGLTFLNNDY